MTNRRPSLSILWSLLVAPLSCREAGDGARAMMTRDSSGVVIVTASSPAWREAAAWRIDSMPLLEVGVESGDEPYQLNRVFEALRRTDGSVLVGNSGSGEIRVFDSTGRFVRAIGRRGNGPGEFGEMSSLRFNLMPDGTLLAYDNGNLRMHYFDSSGTYTRTVRIDPTPAGLRAFYQGVFSDGTWLTLALVPELRNEPGTYLKSSQHFMRYSAEGRPMNTLRDVEGRTRFVHQFGSSTSFPFVPFTSEPLARPMGDRLLVVPTGAPEIEQRDVDGRLARVIRLGLQRERSADAFPRYRERSLAGMDTAQRARYDAFYGLSHALPEYIPAFQGVLADEGGNAWLERFRMPGETDSIWEVVASDGTWLGQVAAPARLRLHQVGRDFVLGRHLDSLGVERIRVHALRRP